MRAARLLVLVSVVLAVSAAHYLTPTGEHAHGLHAFYRWFFHLPIILGAFWFGLRGGAGIAALITVLYLPHVIWQWEGGQAVHWLEIVLYNIVGWVAGFLAEGLRAERDRYRRAAEELLATEEQLRRADRLSVLGELSAGLAHEVRTPLASIRGAAEILAGSTDEAERKEFSDILTREVDRLNRVVADFLTFARPRTDVVPSADLNPAVSDVVKLVGLEAQRKGVRLTEDLGADLPAATIDEERLKQVILNLVMNALQATESGGAVEVGTSADGDRVLLVVADTGCGIPEEHRARIFDPFYTTREGGTGLGLSVVVRILESHGAVIEVRPGDSRGTVAEVGFRKAEANDGR